MATLREQLQLEQEKVAETQAKVRSLEAQHAAYAAQVQSELAALRGEFRRDDRGTALDDKREIARLEENLEALKIEAANTLRELQAGHERDFVSFADRVTRESRRDDAPPLTGDLSEMPNSQCDEARSSDHVKVLAEELQRKDRTIEQLISVLQARESALTVQSVTEPRDTPVSRGSPQDASVPCKIQQGARVERRIIRPHLTCSTSRGTSPSGRKPALFRATTGTPVCHTPLTHFAAMDLRQASTPSRALSPPRALTQPFANFTPRSIGAPIKAHAILPARTFVLQHPLMNAITRRVSAPAGRRRTGDCAETKVNLFMPIARVTPR